MSERLSDTAVPSERSPKSRKTQAQEDTDKCNSCQDCASACPYDVPQFGDDGTMQNCDFCLELGMEPVCVVHCPTEALCYGTMEELSALADEKAAEKLTGPTEPSIFILNKLGNNDTVRSILAGHQ